MSNFICSECGMNNIDCGRAGYKTPKEIELEKENEKMKKCITELKVRLLDIREARDNATKVANTYLDQNADLSKKVERLQEQLKEANKLLKYCCANYESSRFGATITEDGEILPKGPVWNYLKKWKV